MAHKQTRRMTESRPRIDVGAGAEERLDAYLCTLIHSWSSVLTKLGITLVPIFFILDTFMMPAELLPRFAVYRGTATLLILGQYFFIRWIQPSFRSVLHGYFVTVVIGGSIALMVTDLGGFNSTYYAGLNLVLFAVTVLLPWSVPHATANSVLVIMLYVGLNLVFPSEEPVNPALAVNNLFFLFGTAVIAVAISYVKRGLVVQEFLLRSNLKAARDALWGEMEVAKRIQTALLPPLRHTRGYRIAASMIPADEVGGDYYDVIETGAGETWVSVGDVSGHGVASGLVMMMTQTSIYSTVNHAAALAPSTVMDRVNAVIKENISRLGADRYMTLSVIRLEPERLVVAGKHQDILVFRRQTGRVEAVPTTGTWIGVADQLAGHVIDQEIPIAAGDLILLFTDGITEAMNEAGQMFGQSRLEELFQRYAVFEPEEIVARLLVDVQEHLAVQEDDLTLVVLRREPTAPFGKETGT